MGTIWIQIDSLMCLGFCDLSVADELYVSVYITSDNVSLFYSESSKEKAGDMKWHEERKLEIKSSRCKGKVGECKPWNYRPYETAGNECDGDHCYQSIAGISLIVTYSRIYLYFLQRLLFYMYISLYWKTLLKKETFTMSVCCFDWYFNLTTNMVFKIERKATLCTALKS